MPVVDTTQSFATGDTVTSTTLNNIMDQSIFVAGAVVSGSGLAITAGGQMTISDNSLPGGKITDGTITSIKMEDGAVTPAKLSAGGPNWTTSTTSLGNAVTGTYTTNIAPARTGDGSTELQFGSQATVSNNASITRNTGVNGTFAITNTGTGAITLSASGGVNFGSGGVTFGSANMPTPSGNAPIYGCRAWVNFNGQAGSDLGGTYDRNSSTSVTITATAHGLIAGSRVFLDFTVGTGTAPFDGIYEVDSSPAPTANTFSVTSNVSTNSTGTVLLKRKTIRAGGNVSCVSAAQSSPPTSPPTSNQTVDNGYYIVNFSTAMPSANFAISGAANENGVLANSSGNDIIGGFGFNEKCAYITSVSGGSTNTDCLYNSVMFIG